MAENGTRGPIDGAISEQLAELGRVLEAVFPDLFESPAYPAVTIRAVRWSHALAQSLFDLVGVGDGMLYARGRIEAVGTDSFVVQVEESEDRPGIGDRPYVHNAIFGFVRGSPLEDLIYELKRCALKLGLDLELKGVPHGDHG